MGPCPRPQCTRCSNTSTRRMTPWRARWGADNRPRRDWTWREETPLRAGDGYRRRSSATTPWRRARRRRTRQMRPQHGIHSEVALRLTEELRGASPGFRPATQSQLQEELDGQATALEEDIRQLRALLAANLKRAIKDFWRQGQDIVQRWKAVRGATELEAPGQLGLWNLRVPNTQILFTEAHDVMFAVCAFWRELYDKHPVNLPGFQAVLGGHAPRVP